MNINYLEVFSHQITTDKLLRLFEEIAFTVTSEYRQEIEDLVADQGPTPAFEDIFDIARKLNSDLMSKATLIKNDYKQHRGHNSIRLTTGCKRIIKTSVFNLLAQVKIFLDKKAYARLKRESE